MSDLAAAASPGPRGRPACLRPAMALFVLLVGYLSTTRCVAYGTECVDNDPGCNALWTLLLYTPRSPALPVEGVYFWVRANQIGVDDESSVSIWRDLSGNGLDARGSLSGPLPVYRSSFANDQPGVRFTAGQNLIAGLPGDWTFLHDGTGFTLVLVIRINIANSAAQYTILDTGGTTASNRGFFLSYDDGGPEALTSGLMNGTGVAVFDAISANNTFPSLQNVVLSARFDYQAATDDYEARLNGALIHSLESAAAPNSELPQGPLYIGRSWNTGDGIPMEDGTLAEIMFYRGPLTDAQRQLLECHVGQLYGIVVTGC